jgi:glutathione S-transferase
LRAQVRIWTTFCDYQYVFNFFKLLMCQDEQQLESRRQAVRDNLIFLNEACLEKFSNNGPFILGENLSLLDIALYPFLERIILLDHYRNITLPQQCVHLSRWIESMQNLAIVKNTTNTLDEYIKIYAKYANNTVNSTSAKELRDR